MRVLKAILLACALAAWCVAAPVLVQSVAGTPAAKTSIAFTGNTTAGNTIVVVVVWNSITYGPTALRDTQSNIYTEDVAGVPLEDHNYYAFAFHATAKSGADAITITACCGTSEGTVALEYSGLGGFGAASTVAVNPAHPLLAGAVKSAAGDLVLAAFAGGGSETWTVGSGETALYNTSSLLVEYGSGAAGSTTATATANDDSAAYPVGGIALDYVAALAPVAEPAIVGTISEAGYLVTVAIVPPAAIAPPPSAPPTAAAAPCPPPAPKLACAYSITNTGATATGQYVQTWFSTGEPMATEFGTAPATRWTSCMTGQTEYLMGSGNFTSAPISGSCAQ